MTVLSVSEAQQRLPDLLAAAEAGEVVMIRSENGRTFILTVQPPGAVVNPNWPGYPHAGSCQGLFVVPDDFKEPLDELREYTE